MGPVHSHDPRHAAPDARHDGADGPAALLELRGISKAYGGVHALTEATVRCHAGEVHALVGENGAGKSTLVKVLSGAVAPDAGAIVLDGEPIAPRTPVEAARAGIGTVFQELSLVPAWTVAANLLYGMEPRVRLGRIDRGARQDAAAAALERLGLADVDPRARVSELGVAERQVVEIAKVVMRRPRVLLLDEATSALLPAQVDWLFGLAREFADAGGVVVLISHRLEEVERLSDRVTVLRGGRDVATAPTHELPEAQLVELMLGRRVERVYPPRLSHDAALGAPVCELAGFGAPGIHDVDLTLHAGEIVGVGGLAGQGQGALFLGLFGATPSSGSVKVRGLDVDLRTPARAIEAGIGLVPEDRATDGLCLTLGVGENLVLGDLGSISRAGFVRRGRQQSAVAQAVSALQIKLRSPRQPVAALSGGNQQKVLLGRVLARRPAVLLLFDATRGVDVGTKAEIYRLMRAECEQGVAILFYSSDAAELASMSDRVCVIHDGRLQAELRGEDATEENIVAVAVGGRRGAAEPEA